MKEAIANPYAWFSNDPAEYNCKQLKTQLAVTLIKLMQLNGWNQPEASRVFSVTQPRISDLSRGKLERFSIDSLMQMLFRAGYSFDYLPQIEDGELRLEMKLKKAML